MFTVGSIYQNKDSIVEITKIDGDLIRIKKNDVEQVETVSTLVIGLLNGDFVQVQ